jgi:hypothetical protein
MERIYGLFISHSWTYEDQYDRLITLLKERPDFTYVVHSVPKDDPGFNTSNPRALYDAIMRQMRKCHIVIILAGVYAYGSYSEWVDKEIIIAKSEFAIHKPILVIEPWVSWHTSRTSQAEIHNADKIVKWNTESIVSAIRELVALRYYQQ